MTGGAGIVDRGRKARVFVCSPFRPFRGRSRAENVARAQLLCRAACLAGYAPFAPHLFYTAFLDDELEAERRLGIYCDLTWLAAADELWVDAASLDDCSLGMKEEIDYAWRYLEFDTVVAPLGSAKGLIVYNPKAWEDIR